MKSANKVEDDNGGGAAMTEAQSWSKIVRDIKVIILLKDVTNMKFSPGFVFMHSNDPSH